MNLCLIEILHIIVEHEIKIFTFIHKYSYRIPTVEGGKWIVENCRRGGAVGVVGFRSELYENFYKKTKNVCNNTTYTFQKVKDAISKSIIYNDVSTIMADIKSPDSIMDDLKKFR